jgi:hypothetical protein
MNKRQQRIIGILQIIFLPIALLFLGAFVLDFISGERRWLAAVDAVMTPAGDVFAIAVTAVVAFGVIALFIEFVRQELRGGPDRRAFGAPILELTHQGGLGGALLIFLTTAFVVGLNVVAFWPDLVHLDPSTVAFDGKFVFWLIYGVGHFLLLAFTLRVIRHRPWFVVSKQGFYYAPGDLSPGMIRWEDVVRIDETELLSSPGGRGAPVLRKALVVTLRDPDKYLGRYNPLLKVLADASRAVVQAQTGGKEDLVLLADDFGVRYDEVKALMLQHVRT